MSEVYSFAALACRSIILFSLILSAFLGILNGYAYYRGHLRDADRRESRLNVLKGAGITLYGLGAAYGTYTRLDMEFTWALPFMAVGSFLFSLYLFLRVGDGGPKGTMGHDERRLERLIG